MSELVVATLRCPYCGTPATESIAPDACVLSYTCRTCMRAITPHSGDGCTFCSHGDAQCDVEACNTQRCLPCRTDRGHVVVGISPFNSYYTEPRLRTLLAWCAAHFERVDVFVPDTPTEWTLQAGGYAPDEASHKARRQLRYLVNKISKAAEGLSSSITLVNWSTVSQHPAFNDLAMRCRAALEQDAAFRAACIQATDEVLENRRRGGYEPTAADRLRAVEYLLAELPLILFGPELWATATSTFVYHRSLPLFEQIYSGAYSIRPAAGQHFVVAHELPGPGVEHAGKD